MMFSTKAANIRHAKDIMDRNRNKELIGDDLSFVLAILKNHPDYKEKVGAGISRIEVRRTAMNYFGMHIVRVDGSEIDFSYKTCISGKSKSLDSNLREAMREAISDQMRSFKFGVNEQTFTCPICGKNVTEKKNIHADHFNVKFRELYSKFIVGKDLPRSFDDHPVYHCSIFKEEDREFKKAWSQYHKDNCSIRLICNVCNIKEG